MTIKNRWIDKKYGKPTQVVKVQEAGVTWVGERNELKTYMVEIVQEVFSSQTGRGIIGRRYIQAKDEMEAYMRACKGDFDNY